MLFIVPDWKWRWPRVQAEFLACPTQAETTDISFPRAFTSLRLSVVCVCAVSLVDFKLSEPVGCVTKLKASTINCLVCVLPSEPWTMAYSKNSMKKFFFNKLTKKSTYDMPPNAAAPFQYASSSLSVPTHLFLYHSCVLKETFFFFCPQCLPLWAFLLGLGGWSDRPRLTDEDGPWETIQRWYHVLRPPELPALNGHLLLQGQGSSIIPGVHLKSCTLLFYVG